MQSLNWTTLSAEMVRGARFVGVGVAGLAMDAASLYRCCTAKASGRPVARAVSLRSPRR